MSLPTPPGTSHREEKDNRVPRFGRVSWSEATEYHAITTSPPRTFSGRANSLKAGPSRSILKKTLHPILPTLEEDVREPTPEPEDSLADLHYLTNPVARILAVDASLRDLIEAYSILAARLKSCVTGNTDADASWPLFQPLRKNHDAFVNAVVRDIQQVFVDPLEGTESVTDSPSSPREPPSASTLPSPRDSPRKKKLGMTAEQVKRARDLSGVCQAVLRLLSVVFTLPSLYNLFDEEELGYILTQVLAIPLANKLPTPNARKTCALAIWLIQIQRLPAEVLEPASDRIAYALRRGIEGELGKEGKKGSASDGLKAIHDLALYQPAIFVPAFMPILGAILANLLAPTLLMRSQACHALGGLALAASSLPPSEAHTRASTIIASRLMKKVDASPTTPSKKRGDSSPSKDSALVRTLRTTLQAADPKHSAQGPVWAFSAIAHLVVLLGPTVYMHSELTRTILALFSLGMRHTKSSVRALGCLAWRAMAWAYFRAPHVKLTVDTETDGDEDSASEDDLVEERQRQDEAMLACFKFLPSIVDMGAGVGTVGALLGQEMMDEMRVMGALRVLRNMSRKGGQTCKDAMDLARHLLSSALSSNTAVEKEWNHRMLLSPSFFSANPGLLTAEWTSLSSAVKPLLEECPHIEDVRALTLDEVASPGMWDEFLAVWKDGLSVLRLGWGSEEIPTEVREIWFNLLKCHVTSFMENDDHDGLSELAKRAGHILVGILGDDTLDFALHKGDDTPTSPVKPSHSRTRKLKKDDPLPQSRWNYAVKLFLVRDLFTITSAVFSQELFAEIAESVVQFLNAHEEDLVGDVQCTDEVREQWACLCAEAAFACDASVLQAFWNNSLRKGQRWSDWHADVRVTVWQTFLERWAAGDVNGSPSCDYAVMLLSIPFVEASCWDMSSEDIDAWDHFLRRAIDAALDNGVDATTLINQIAGLVVANLSPAATSAVRVADLLLSNVEIADARQAPTEIFEFVNDTLNASYPPAPRHKVMCMWLIRSLTRVIDACPQELCLSMLEELLVGLQTWLTDDFDICSAEEYSSDILPLYQTMLLSMQSLPSDVEVLQTLAPLLVAPFCGRKDKHGGSVEAFAEYWQATYAGLPEPSPGHSEQILQCLDAVAQARLEEEEDVAKVEDMTAISDQPPSSSVIEVPEAQAVVFDVNCEDTVEGEDEGSVVVPSPGTLTRLSLHLLRSATSSPQALSASIALPPIPTTPKTSPDMRSLLRNTPTRPHKSAIKEYGVADLMDLSPASPTAMGSSPTRAPMTPKRSPPKIQANKENVSPLRIRSLTERLAMRSPLLLESVLGKHPRNDDDAEDIAALDETASKKGRLEASPLVTSLFTNIHVHTVMHDSSVTLKELPIPSASSAEPLKGSDADKTPHLEVELDAAVQATPSPITRKRKGVFMEAVEVPSVAQLFRTRRHRSLQVAGPSTAPDFGVVPAAPSPQLRRTRSATKLLGERVDFQRLGSTPKKRRVSRATELREEAAELSSPLRSIRDAALFGSDDSIMRASPIEAPDLPPSDDDPHIGQVTPHRLVSPAIRRARHMQVLFDSDPPSDDSNVSNSPSHDRVVRKIARLGSEQLMSAKPTPLGVRPRSLSAFSSSSSALGSDS